jgi:hypothetical protein
MIYSCHTRVSSTPEEPSYIKEDQSSLVPSQDNLPWVGVECIHYSSASKSELSAVVHGPVELNSEYIFNFIFLQQ